MDPFLAEQNLDEIMKNNISMPMGVSMESIYRLTVVRREISKDQYAFNVYDDELYYYLTKEDAEAKIFQTQPSIDIYNFIIEECPLGRNVRKNVRRRWVYDRDGQYVSGTLCSELKDSRTGNPDESFPGRESNQCRFEQGDIVEVRRDDLVTLEIVYMQPPSPEDIEIHDNLLDSEESSNPAEKDYREDSYVTLGNFFDKCTYSPFDSVRQDAYVTDVMPPQRGVNDKVAECLKKILKAVEFEIEVVRFDETLLQPHETGLEYTLSIRSKWSLKQPAVVVDIGDNMALTFSVETAPKIITGYEDMISDTDRERIKAWIVLNQTIIQEYWEQSIDSLDLSRRQKKISSSQ